MQLSDLLKKEDLAKLNEVSVKNVSEDEMSSVSENGECYFRTTKEMLEHLRNGGQIVPSKGFEREGFSMTEGIIKERYMVMSDDGIPLCYKNDTYSEEEFLTLDKFGIRHNGLIMFWKRK